MQNCRIIFLVFLISLIIPSSLVKAERYDAKIKTDSGTYKVPVEVEDNTVTKIIWPNGGRMRVYGGEIEDNETRVRDTEGNRIKIELPDDYHSEE